MQYFWRLFSIRCFKHLTCCSPDCRGESCQPGACRIQSQELRHDLCMESKAVSTAFPPRLLKFECSDSITDFHPSFNFLPQDLNKEVARIDTIPSQSLETIKVIQFYQTFCRLHILAVDLNHLALSTDLFDQEFLWHAGLADIYRNEVFWVKG